MANEEQLSILKQGVVVWNKWRKENPYTDIDLNEVHLSNVSLVGANLNDANLKRADLNKVCLSEADLSTANLWRADLRGAILIQADLGEAFLRGASLRGANLLNADLSEADLRGADLIQTNLRGAKLCLANLHLAILDEADLCEADLTQTNLVGAHLTRGNLTGAVAGATIFGSSISDVIGLGYIKHRGPSIIPTAAFTHSKGEFPKTFLRGCGLSDWEIEKTKLYNPDLSNEEITKILYKIYDLRANQAIQISPLFISYSHTDSIFVEKLESYLNKKGIRFWRDVHHATAGRLEKQIDRAIRQNPTVLLILSSHSIRSDWVEHEIRTAREVEKETKRDALCPIALDDSWKDSPWPKRVVEQVMEYNILDFSDWKDDSKFEAMFRKLVDGLELFY